MPRKRKGSSLLVALNGKRVGLLDRAASGALVSAYFDNLLPDNDDIRRIVAERVGAEGTDAFSLLERIGRDCAGALQFVPAGEALSTPTAPTYHPLSDPDVAQTIRDLATAPLGVRVGGDTG